MRLHERIGAGTRLRGLAGTALSLLAGTSALGDVDLEFRSSAGAPAGRHFDGDADSWTWWTPKPSWTIDWTTGRNLADNTLQMQRHNTVTKFDFPGGVPAGKFASFSWPGIFGLRGSSVDTWANQNSSYVSGVADFTWAGHADTVLGTGPGARWQARVYGDDPFTMTQSDLDAAGIRGPLYDLFIPVGLESARFPGQRTGRVELSVAYDTAAVSYDLLRVLGDSSGVTVATQVAPVDVTFYRMGSLHAGPAVINDSVPITLAQLQAILESDLTDGELDQPVYVGLFVNDLVVPVEPLRGDILAQVRVESGLRGADAADGDPWRFLPWHVDFDRLDPGPLSEQSPWVRNHVDFLADAWVTDALADSIPNAIAVDTQFLSTDVTYPLEARLTEVFDSGARSLRFDCQVYVPSDYDAGPVGGSSLSLLDGNGEPLVELRIGQTHVESGNGSAPIVHDAFGELKVEFVRTAAGRYTVRTSYNREPIDVWVGSWTDETRIGGVRLHANEASVLYYDDFSFDLMMPEQVTTLDGIAPDDMIEVEIHP